MQRRTFMGFAGATAIAALSGCSTKAQPNKTIKKNSSVNIQTFNTSLKKMREKN
ncbi:MAG: twin-arginine translocation signal domain-containing protein [Campylobacterota bacterium]|nr:twin-arginine translocation signal domain-containing protein [Campylobacterota bacterium]